MVVAVIYVTTNNMQTARKISRVLVKEKLVACVNIIPKIESIYRWEGKVEKSKEAAFIAKTVESNVKKTICRIKELHTYDVPEIIVLPIVGGLKEYLNYIVDETKCD